MAKRRDARSLLIVAAILTVVLWQLPFGRQILYPFTLLATYAHEMGHGLTALLVGCKFKSLEMYADGSGRAWWTGADGASLVAAIVSAGGLIGPSIAGGTVLIASRRPSRAPTILLVLGLLMGVTAVVWARSAFALFFILAFAASFVLVARYASGIAPFFVQLVGVQLCLSVFNDLGYMFSAGAVVGGEQQLSDTAVIARALLLPYWFWGGLVAVLAFSVLAGSLWIALRGEPST